jgi:hypothetical protein
MSSGVILSDMYFGERIFKTIFRNRRSAISVYIVLFFATVSISRQPFLALIASVRDSADKARRVFQIGTKQARGTAVDLRGNKLCVLVDTRRALENKNPVFFCLPNIRLVRVHTEQGKIGCGASRQALSVFCKDILENMIIQSEVRY